MRSLHGHVCSDASSVHACHTISKTREEMNGNYAGLWLQKYEARYLITSWISWTYATIVHKYRNIL